MANIIRYIASEHPPAARRMKRLLEDSVLPAAEHPYLYRQSGRIPGLREIVAMSRLTVMSHNRPSWVAAKPGYLAFRIFGP